jgi:hypothetical protein
MREQDGPAVADPVMEVDGSLRCLGSEIGSFVIDTQHIHLLKMSIACARLLIGWSYEMRKGESIPPEQPTLSYIRYDTKVRIDKVS